MRKIPFPAIVVATLLLYAACHLPEEAAGNFPAFMSANWNIPAIGYARWLFHNAAIFMPALLAGLLVFSLDRDRLLPFGLGISLWGALNFCEHLFFTLKNRSVAPGFWSSCLFLALAALALMKLKASGSLTRKALLLSLAATIAYWAIPIGLILLLAPVIGGIFS